MFLPAEGEPMQSHLAAVGSNPESGPEEQLISALIESGTYDPRRYRVHDSMIKAHRTVHQFCMNYQRTAGEAPPHTLVCGRFPSFKFIPGLSPSWAAAAMLQADTDRNLRRSLSSIATAIREEAHGEAISLMNQAIRSYSSGSTSGTDALDFEVLEQSDATSVVPVPGNYLSSLTGGHAAGDLWLVSAMWGVGKSWRLLEHAIAALEAGWDVAFFSLEMLPAGILKRLHTVALRDVPGAPLMHVEDRRKILRDYFGKCGQITIYGPNDGRVDASTIAGVVSNTNTLVCVDYVGRMYTTAGQPARDDWSKVSMISQELCEYAAMLEIPILAAVQLNRQGTVAGSMDLERDASLLLEISRLSDKCNGARKNTIRKSRNTESLGSWYSRFDAVNGRFGDITSSEALEIQLAEEAQPA